jgi:RIP metalloprotease RseP
MNAVFAVLAFSALAGTRGVDRTQTTQIDSVWVSELPAGAEALGALQRGDRIAAVNGVPITSWEELLEKLFTLPPPVTVQVEGRPAPLTVTVPLDQAARSALVGALDPFFPTVIDSVSMGAPAQRAGMQVGDRVVAVDGAPVAAWYQFTRMVRASDGRTLLVEVERDGARLTLALTPERRLVTDPHTGTREMGGFLGVGPRLPVVHERFGFAGAVAEGTRRSVQISGQVLGAVAGLVTGRVSLRELAVPSASVRYRARPRVWAWGARHVDGRAVHQPRHSQSTADPGARRRWAAVSPGRGDPPQATVDRVTGEAHERRSHRGRGHHAVRHQ